LQTISSADVRELITAGRIIEARTLLALDDGALAEDERRALETELDRLCDEAEGRVAKAEALEQAGWTEEAKAAYESVLSVVVDFPGVQDHVKRLDDALALTKAVQRRNRRLRHAPKTRGKTSATKKRLPMLLGGGLTVAAAGMLLLFWFAPQAQQSPPPVATEPDLAVQATPPVPATTPAEPTPTELTPTPPEQPTVAGPAAPPPTDEAPPAAAAPPTEPPPPAQTPEPAPAPKPTDATYTVQAGDSLSLIALRQLCNQGAWKKIYQRNKKAIRDPQILMPGTQLQLSGIENHCPQAQPDQTESPATR